MSKNAILNFVTTHVESGNLNNYCFHFTVIGGDDVSLIISQKEIDRLADMVEALRSFKPTHKHIKRGSSYETLRRGLLQTDKPLEDNAILQAYCDESGNWFFRTPEEFNDGRFEPLGESQGDSRPLPPLPRD